MSIATLAVGIALLAGASMLDPSLIAWAGGAGFVVGLIGTELCRRRRR